MSCFSLACVDFQLSFNSVTSVLYTSCSFVCPMVSSMTSYLLTPLNDSHLCLWFQSLTAEAESWSCSAHENSETWSYRAKTWHCPSANRALYCLDPIRQVDLTLCSCSVSSLTSRISRTWPWKHLMFSWTDTRCLHRKKFHFGSLKRTTAFGSLLPTL